MQAKTEANVLTLIKMFSNKEFFGRSDVMNALDIKESRASELLKELLQYKIIEPVSGHGKGKYHFTKA